MLDNLHLETELIHGGYAAGKEYGTTTVPIFQSASLLMRQQKKWSLFLKDVLPDLYIHE